MNESIERKQAELLKHLSELRPYLKPETYEEIMEAVRKAQEIELDDHERVLENCE